MGFEDLGRPLVSLSLWLPCRPYVCLAVLATTYYVLSIIAERSMYLTARVFVAFEFKLEALVSEVVDPYSRVVAGDQKFDFSIWVIWWVVDGLYAGDLASPSVLTMC